MVEPLYVCVLCTQCKGPDRNGGEIGYETGCLFAFDHVYLMNGRLLFLFMFTWFYGVRSTNFKEKEICSKQITKAIADAFGKIWIVLDQMVYSHHSAI